MKKSFILFTIAGAMTLASCGENKTTTETDTQSATETVSPADDAAVMGSDTGTAGGQDMSGATTTAPNTSRS